jgi:hypothetical protein
MMIFMGYLFIFINHFNVIFHQTSLPAIEDVPTIPNFKVPTTTPARLPTSSHQVVATDLVARDQDSIEEERQALMEMIEAQKQKVKLERGKSKKSKKKKSKKKHRKKKKKNESSSESDSR